VLQHSAEVSAFIVVSCHLDHHLAAGIIQVVNSRIFHNARFPDMPLADCVVLNAMSLYISE
jgi:hypothetical protein